MLRELSEKIEELVENKVEPEIETIDGIDYVKTYNGYSRLQKDKIDSEQVNTLTGLTKMLIATIDSQEGKNYSLPLLVKVEGNHIDVFTNIQKDNERQYLISSNPLVPNINFGRYQPVEQMVISLSTAFVNTPNTTALLTAISNLRQVNEVSYEDDGITQKVTATNGTSINKEWKLQPIVLLKPIRSYAEIEQVETKYLLRVDRDGEIALFEADGGQWKFEAQKRIVEYLENNLKQLIKEDKVRIIG